ncbi:MAG: endonuclease/exonuclease/phosphatase family protein [Bryobacteraceae bacterium]|jgi:endonuclease/exonuclease/phosphatase family metal-dependent hydrolase
MNKRLILMLWPAILPLLAVVREPPTGAQEFLSFDELASLSNTDQPAEPLAEKLDRLLRTPIVSNRAALAGERPHRPLVDGIGPVLRVASWNIERGLNFDLIRLALSDPDGFKQAALERGAMNATKMANIEHQLTTLRDADVIVLNEVDLGMKRTDYRDVARDLAQALGMNYVFGVEFVEVDRLEDLGLENYQLEDRALTQQIREDLAPDPARYLGLHGSAILSRYPILSARIFRLPVCHDWYNTEKAEVSKLEKGKRLAANKVFLERIEREVRRGGRMAIIADVQIPDLPDGVATVVNVHLENKCKPECRTRQMDALLSRIKEVGHPVIVAGDLNTTGFDGAPTSIRHEILNRVKNYEFWVTQALRWGTPASLPLAVLTPVRYFKNHLDPTSTHLPVVAANKEAILFRHVEKFRFVDQYAFDFRGETEHNLHGKGGTLANSNQRARKGFEPTFTLKRDFGGLVGRYKLDWFFVKPYIPRPRGDGMSYYFAPHFPMTMRDLNNAVPDGVSDHAPITVDLPLVDPAKTK